MIELLFSKILQLNSRLNKIRSITATSLYGNAMMGSVVVAKPDDFPTDLPEAYTNQWTPSSGAAVMTEMENRTKWLTPTGVYNFTQRGSQDFKNLYINTGCTLKMSGDYGIIRVQDTLTLKGTIDLSTCHAGAVSISNTPASRSLIDSLNSSFILPEIGVFVTGGSGAPGIFDGGPVTGGVLAVFYTHLYDEENHNLYDEIKPYVRLNGGSSGNSGGCLFVMARKIVVSDNAAIDVHGGEGTSVENAGILFNNRMKAIDL